MNDFITHHYNEIIDELGSKNDLTEYQKEVLSEALLWDKLVGDARTEEYAEEYIDEI